MSRLNRALTSPLAKNAASAAVAGVVTYVRPGRLPRWARRGLLAINTTGAGTSMLVGGAAAGSGLQRSPAPLASRLGSRGAPVSGAADGLTALTGGVVLLTSSPALKAQVKLSEFLVSRGVRRPRLVVAVTAAGVVFVLGVLTDQAAKAAERKALEMQAKDDDRPQAISFTGA